MNRKAPQQEVVKGQILDLKNKTISENGKLQSVQYTVKLDNGKTVTATFQPGEISGFFPEVGSQIVMTHAPLPQGIQYHIVDSYRLPSLLCFLLAFVVIAVVIVGKKGIGSLLGLIISLIVILYGIVPLILKGYDPLLVTVGFSLVILLSTTYLAHGVSKQTTIALLATFISLLLTLFISLLCITVLNLNGLGSEEVYDLFFATGNAVNARGLLLSGIIIATLGALNDVTVTQAVTIFEMKKLHHGLSFGELLKRGLHIGQEHGASMVNTLVLAYAGSSLFIFIFFIVNPQQQPLWAILNNEFMVEEIVKTLGGTMGILLSVPIVTLLAAYFAEKLGRVSENYLELFHSIIQNIELYWETKEEIEAISALKTDQESPSMHITL